MATQIKQRQIADGAINDAKVAAGANIATSKLQDGGEFLKRDGSVVLTADLSANSNKITNLGNPSFGSDAANKTYVDSQISSLNSIFDSKGSVRVATVFSGTLATAFANGETVDGIVLSTGDRILLKNQASPAENGIYIVNASGVPTRSTDMDAWTEVPGAFVVVEQGTSNADTVWMCTSNQGGTINSTAINWQQIPTSPGLTNSNFIDKEIPSGDIDGVNSTYILSNTPVVGSEHVYLNGLLQESGGGNDYTISGLTITMAVAPLAGEKLRVTYRI